VAGWSYQRHSDSGAGHSLNIRWGVDDLSLGRERAAAKYAGGVSDAMEYQVSSSGQMSLPASARHRWHLDQGGPVDVLDLGFGVLTVPRGEGRRMLGDVLSREDHAAFVASLADDPELATT
jgi:hypothetical protein